MHDGPSLRSVRRHGLPLRSTPGRLRPATTSTPSPGHLTSKSTPSTGLKPLWGRPGGSVGLLGLSARPRCGLIARAQEPQHLDTGSTKIGLELVLRPQRAGRRTLKKNAPRDQRAGHEARARTISGARARSHPKGRSEAEEQTSGRLDGATWRIPFRREARPVSVQFPARISTRLCRS